MTHVERSQLEESLNTLAKRQRVRTLCTPILLSGGNGTFQVIEDFLLPRSSITLSRHQSGQPQMIGLCRCDVLDCHGDRTLLRMKFHFPDWYSSLYKKVRPDHELFRFLNYYTQ